MTRADTRAAAGSRRSSHAVSRGSAKASTESESESESDGDTAPAGHTATTRWLTSWESRWLDVTVIGGTVASPAAGDAATQAAHLADAVGLWRGDPLTDLERVPELSIEVDHLRMQLLDALLTLGELRLSEGAPSTVDCAERALAADPYDERAFRLLIAAHLQRGDRSQVRSAVERTLAMLRDLGVDPSPQTAILVRQAEMGARPTGPPA